jgi:outer membrane protein insertion porin family
MRACLRDARRLECDPGAPVGRACHAPFRSAERTRSLRGGDDITRQESVYARPRRRPRLAAGRAVVRLVLAMACLAASGEPVLAQSSEGPVVTAVLPFEVHSAKPLDYLETSLAELLVTRLESSGRILVVESETVREGLIAVAGERSETTVRRLAGDLGADWVVAGSLTELAGRYSLDVKVTPIDARDPTRTLVFTAQDDDELLDRVNELADRVLEVLGTGTPRSQVAEVRVEGAADEILEGVAERLRLQPGTAYESALARDDLRELRDLPGVAAASFETERTPEGVVVIYRLVPKERLIPQAALESGDDRVAEVRIRGNKRIEANAIRARLETREGNPFNPALVAGDVREIQALGFFRNVRVLSEDSLDGRIVTFEVEENPVVRQVSIAGNENVDGDKIRDSLTITTGSTLDYPLLFENRERIVTIYRAEGYYLAQVTYEIEALQGDSVSIHFEVDEGAKLDLAEIEFTGNEHFSDDELVAGLKTKKRRWYSIVTRFFDRSGTYSEPVFLQDLQTVTERYMNDGYLQVDVGEPDVLVVEDDKGDDELVVKVPVTEGRQFRVGSVDVQGDTSIDLVALRERVNLQSGEVFNRSHLTEDVEDLERFYTDRGFFYASVAPRTKMNEVELTVDVVFAVEKGDLHFIREIEITGNRNTIDPVVRREVQMVEGELYAQRSVERSKNRIRRLGFFEEVEFEVETTDYAEQLDLDVQVVEKPTGSLSFGAGYSTQDSIVVSGSVSQANLFGRGWGVQAAVDWGQQTSRLFFSFYNPYFLGSTWSFRTSFFRTEIEFDQFRENETGVEFGFGHDLNLDGTAHGQVRYSFSSHEIERLTNENATSMVFRELLSDDQTTSLGGLSFVSDTRDDRVAPSDGHVYGGNFEFAGLGGFSTFLRMEGRAIWFTRPPGWLPSWFPFRDESTIVFGLRAGYTLPFNSIDDYSFDLPPALNTASSSELQSLQNIDTDLELPLTERYFLGGLGNFQLRGFEARTVGPRRTLLKRVGIGGALGLGNLFTAVGREAGFIDQDTGAVSAACVDNGFNQGDGDGDCNSIFDTEIDDFDDLDETDVIGGNSFFSGTLEYRFPVSEQLGLIGIVFLDFGNAFDETQNMFDVGEWRWGTGFGLLWFSPFGPLQGFVGFPLDRLEIEDSTVFEFSVGGAAL